MFGFLCVSWAIFLFICSPATAEEVEDVPAPEDNGGGFDDPFDAPVEDSAADDGDAGFGDDDDLFNADPSSPGGFEAVDAVEQEPEPEPEPQQDSAQLIFARQFRATVQERDEAESAKRQERVERAEAEMEQFRSMRAEKREKTASSNREAEKELEQEREAEKTDTNSWAQVVKNIDTQATSDDGKTDAARMRSVLIQLKNNPLKPPQSAAAAPAE
mgnify:CR=1 FL=1